VGGAQLIKILYRILTPYHFKLDETSIIASDNSKKKREIKETSLTKKI
jgi:hypothetical protein